MGNPLCNFVFSGILPNGVFGGPACVIFVPRLYLGVSAPTAFNWEILLQKTIGVGVPEMPSMGKALYPFVCSFM
jgi:hypothetical protein